MNVMPTKVYRTPPVTPTTHLEQLVSLKKAKGEKLSAIQKLVKKSLLSRPSLKAMRMEQILEMAIAGFSDERIKLAFAHPDSPLLPLLEGFEGREGMSKFQTEINKAQQKAETMGPEEHRALYVRSCQQLLTAAWGHVGRVEPPQVKALLEFMGKLMQDAAEASGVLKQRAGKRPNTRRSGREIISPEAESSEPPGTASPPAEESSLVESELWEEGFEPDDERPEDSTAL